MDNPVGRVVVTEKGLNFLKDLFKVARNNESVSSKPKNPKISLLNLSREEEEEPSRLPYIFDPTISSKNVSNLMIDDAKSVEEFLLPRIDSKYLSPFMRRKISLMSNSITRSPAPNSSKNHSNDISKIDLTIPTSRSRKASSKIDYSDPKRLQLMSNRLGYSENYLEKLIEKHNISLEKAKKTRENILGKKKTEFEEFSRMENKAFSNNQIGMVKEDLEREYDKILQKKTFYKNRYKGQISDLHRKKYKLPWSVTHIPE